MSEQDLDGVAEDDGVLEPADTLDSDDLLGDVLDTGVDAGEGYRGANRFGTTAAEERTGESLDQLLAEEEPEAGSGQAGTDEDDDDDDDDRDPEPRSGRLVAPDDGAHEDDESNSVAFDVGIDGGAATAEEAAVHLTEEPPFS
jgi:hypothetical protein